MLGDLAHIRVTQWSNDPCHGVGIDDHAYSRVVVETRLCRPSHNCSSLGVGFPPESSRLPDSEASGRSVPKAAVRSSTKQPFNAPHERPSKTQKTASFHHELTRLTTRWHLDRVLLEEKRRLNFLCSPKCLANLGCSSLAMALWIRNRHDHRLAGPPEDPSDC